MQKKGNPKRRYIHLPTNPLRPWVPQMCCLLRAAFCSAFWWCGVYPACGDDGKVDGNRGAVLVAFCHRPWLGAAGLSSGEQGFVMQVHYDDADCRPTSDV